MKQRADEIMKRMNNGRKIGGMALPTTTTTKGDHQKEREKLTKKIACRELLLLLINQDNDGYTFNFGLAPLMNVPVIPRSAGKAPFQSLGQDDMIELPRWV